MSTAVRLTHTGGNTDFALEEVEEVRVEHLQRIDLFWKQDNYVHQYFVNDEYLRVRVRLRRHKITTLTKAETVWNKVDSYYQAEKMDLYYKYHIDNSTSIKVQLDRDNFQWQYYQGRQVGDVPIEMIFIQTEQ